MQKKVKFEVYDDGKKAESFSLNNAYMFGMDAIPLRNVSKIAFSQGILHCEKKNNDAAGLALLWPIKGFGRLMMQTTRLPDREKPYLLNLELARAKLMDITVKLEEWIIAEELKEFQEAKELFIEALDNIQNPPVASVLADNCMKKAVIFAESLAEKNAENMIKLRRRATGFSRHSLGCSIDPNKLSDEKYFKKLNELFGFITIPISWSDIEKSNGNYDFSSLDVCFNAINNKKIAVCVGPLLCFDKNFLPEWLISEKLSFDQIRESAYNFVNAIVDRYSQKVHAWRVISGINAMNYFGFNFEQILEITRAGIMAARASDGRAIKIVETIFPWGEYYNEGLDTIPPFIYLDMVMQSGINPDGLGTVIKFGKSHTGFAVRDMMSISSILDKFQTFGKSVHITAVEIPGASNQKDFDLSIWRKRWDDAVHSKWIEMFYKIALGKLFVNTITYSVFADSPDTLMPQSGLVYNDLSEKKSYITLSKIQKAILVKQ